MEKWIWLGILIPLSILFTGIGIYAWRRKKPMWFWSGSTVRESEVKDIPAYNRANGIMWITYSLIFWVSAFIGFLNPEAAGVTLAVGCIGGIPLLIIAYKLIYQKYRA